MKKREEDENFEAEDDYIEKKHHSASNNVLTVIVALLFVALVAIYFITQRVGSRVGMAAGTGTGVISAVTEDIPQGVNDGTEAGLSAEDTVVEVLGILRKSNELEVLSASLQITDTQSISNSYQVIYKGDAYLSCSIDMSKVQVNYNPETGSIDILLPEINNDLSIDLNSIDKLAERKEFSFKVKANDGAKAFQNSYKAISEKTFEELDNYEWLKQEAEDAAKKQVRNLVSNLGVLKKNVNVYFQTNSY